MAGGGQDAWARIMHGVRNGDWLKQSEAKTCLSP